LRKTATLLLASLSAGMGACQKRSFHQESESQTISSFLQPRFAFENAGLGWCAYKEDTTLQPKLFRTNYVYVDISYDLETLIERRDRFQRIFALRSYNKTHDVAIDFDAFSKWSQPLFSHSSMNDKVFSAIIQMERELSATHSDLNSRRHAQVMCEKRAAEDEAANKSGQPLSQDDFAIEYRLRCQYGAEQAIRHSDAAVLSPEGYRLVEKAIYELSHDTKWQTYWRTGVKCRDTISHLESSRGQYLGSESKKR
jgi:hypothetical protein